MKRALFIILIVVHSVTLNAQVPRTIVFQGVLTDANGTVNTTAVSADFVFSLVDASTNTTVWKEPRSGALTKTIQRGMFNHTLGSIVSLDINFDKPLVLRIKANSVTLPDVDLNAAPYAFRAAMSDSTTSLSQGTHLTATLRAEIAAMMRDSLGTQTTLSIPVGTILAFSGDGIALANLKTEGWAVCDGLALSSLLASPYNLNSAQVLALQTVLSSGQWTGGGANLPDLRGYFLRGANAGGLIDAQGFKRDSVTANSSRGVGNYELDAFQGHVHNSVWNDVDNYITASTHTWSTGLTNVLTSHGISTGGETSGYSACGLPSTISVWGATNKLATWSAYGDPRYQSETRPKNIAINYIIKIR